MRTHALFASLTLASLMLAGCATPEMAPPADGYHPPPPALVDIRLPSGRVIQRWETHCWQPSLIDGGHWPTVFLDYKETNPQPLCSDLASTTPRSPSRTTMWFQSGRHGVSITGFYESGGAAAPLYPELPGFLGLSPGPYGMPAPYPYGNRSWRTCGYWQNC